MKIFLLIFLLIITSCKRENNDCISDQSIFIKYNRDDVFRNKKLLPGQSFTFHKICKEPCQIKVESVTIFCPKDITYFSKEKKETCSVVRTKLLADNKFVTDTIKSGTVIGNLINKDSWEIKIDIDNFNFSGTVSEK